MLWRRAGANRGTANGGTVYKQRPLRLWRPAPSRRRAITCLALVCTIAGGASAAGAIAAGPSAAGTAADRSSTAAAATTSDTPLYGVTIDRITHLASILGALAALPERPTTRVYFDVHEPAGYYAHALEQIEGVSTVMGELLDSSDEKAISTAAFQERVESYLHALGPRVGIWEIGNEVNGDWTGSYPVVAAKMTEAYTDVHAAGGTTALTLYANDFGPDNCGDGPAELTPLQFTQQYVPAEVADGLDYVLLSYYPTQCGGREPSSEELVPYLQQLHALYPNAALGFGEVGLPHPASRSSLSKAKQIMIWAYSMQPDLPYYIGGCFWWYGAEDALHPGARLGTALHAAFEDESAALAHQPTP